MAALYISRFLLKTHENIRHLFLIMEAEIIQLFQEKYMMFNHCRGEVRMTSKLLRVHSAISSLSLINISVPTSTDVHILFAGGVPGSCNTKQE